MGICCQINLFKPPDGAFYSGELVSGMIKYALDEPMDIEKITISLKGMGRLRMTERNNRNNRRTNHINSEVYVDTDEVVQEGTFKAAAGAYKLKFNFILPKNIPPSFEFHKHLPKYRVNCSIKYYVRIKFDRPGWFAFAKHFRKEITVASTITPKLSMEPVIYGERRTLLHLFSSKSSTVIMKANILNSVIPNGGKIEVQSEIENDTNVIVRGVETQLIEVYKFKAPGHTEVRAVLEIPNCDFKTSSIKCGDTQIMPIEINVPSDRLSLENSNLVSRDYAVRITAELPIPHRNVVLEIPVQIGDKIQRENISDPPPTYWEAMGEVKKEDEASDDEPSQPSSSFFTTEGSSFDKEKGEKS